MIPIASGDLFLLSVVFWIGVIAVLWFRHERKKENNYDWTITKDQLYNCTRCHLTFLAANDSENITRCPRCNEMCFLRRKKHL